ncbi:hypothetical protein KC19_11G108900 [Ceratodon purpureus]|uniref:Uncharacterized protein n=1 Tax=Ceratodon purpureus TaxID=3225 RepID=A0A8T0GD83_CERPU|nr:hypothetical protein KC19_11G108900 [Ceratodon purpureus]
MLTCQFYDMAIENPLTRNLLIHQNSKIIKQGGHLFLSKLKKLSSQFTNSRIPLLQDQGQLKSVTINTLKINDEFCHGTYPKNLTSLLKILSSVVSRRQSLG